jgi:hypothetical protein
MPGFTPISSIPDPNVTERLTQSERKPGQPQGQSQDSRVEAEDDDSKASPVSSDGHAGPGGRDGNGRLDRVG